MKQIKKPFTCSKCGKGSFISTCAVCLLPEAFIETQIEALDLDIKASSHKQRKESIKKIVDNNNRMKIEDILKIKLKKNKKLPIKSSGNGLISRFNFTEYVLPFTLLPNPTI